MSALQREVLDTAAARAARDLGAEVGGAWCDALALLLVAEWPPARARLLQPAPQSTSVAIQAWMQVIRSRRPLLAYCADALHVQTPKIQVPFEKEGGMKTLPMRTA